MSLRTAYEVLTDPDRPHREHEHQLTGTDWTIWGETAVDVLSEFASGPLHLRRRASVPLRELLASGAEGARNVLVRLTTDADPLVRSGAILALGRCGDPAAVSGCLSTLADPVHRLRAGDSALATLVEVGDPGLAAELLHLELRTPDDRDGLLLGAVHLAARLPGADWALLLGDVVRRPVVSSPSCQLAALRVLRRLRDPGSCCQPFPPQRPDRADWVRGAVTHDDLQPLAALDSLSVQRELGHWIGR